MQGDIIRIFRNLIQIKNNYTKAAEVIINSSEYNYIGEINDNLKRLIVRMIECYSRRLLDKESPEFNSTDYSIYEDFIRNNLFDFASYIINKGIEEFDFNKCIKSYYQTKRNKSYQTRYAVSVSNSKRGKSLEYCIEQFLNNKGSSSKHKNALRRLKKLLSTDTEGVKRYIYSLNKKEYEQETEETAI